MTYPFPYTIYQIRNPLTRKVIWVGKTKDFVERQKSPTTKETNFALHMECAYLRSHGHQPIYEIIQTNVPVWLVGRREGYWIRLLAKTDPLHNLSSLNEPKGKEGTDAWQHFDEQFYKDLEQHEWRQWLNA